MQKAKSIETPADVVRILLAYRWRWLVPAIALAGLAATYSCVRDDVWNATQALIVRNEGVSQSDVPGKFRHLEEMKTTQETILELATSRGVLTAALISVGPPTNYSGTLNEWPTPLAVAGLREVIKVTPPKGAEFGKTEIFYLNVKDKSRERAIDLATAVCDQLELSFRALRDARASSVISELEKTVAVARNDLTEPAERLATFERETGVDLAELRNLTESAANNSDLRRKMNEIELEIRDFRTRQVANEQLMELLKAAQEDSTRLLAAPNRLLDSQPALLRLKEGLIDAQLVSARLRGSLKDAHPQVQSARIAEQEIVHEIQSETTTALRGLEVEFKLTADRIRLLETEWNGGRDNLTKLAEKRAGYAACLAEFKHKQALYEKAMRDLAEARASQAAAASESLLSRIDVPDVGAKPIGPGRSLLIAVGTVGGCLAGVGLVLLTVPFGPPRGTPAPSVVDEDSHDPAPFRRPRTRERAAKILRARIPGSGG